VKQLNMNSTLRGGFLERSKHRFLASPTSISPQQLLCHLTRYSYIVTNKVWLSGLVGRGVFLGYFILTPIVRQARSRKSLGLMLVAEGWPDHLRLVGNRPCPPHSFINSSPPKTHKWSVKTLNTRTEIGKRKKWILRMWSTPSVEALPWPGFS
jgi:hypothetical protein